MKIKLLPSGLEIEVDPNKTVLQICTENQIEIKSICKGVPSCAECRVKLVQGEHVCLPPSNKELAVLGNNFFLDGRRLSCQLRAFGDITVDISEQLDRIESQKKKIRGFRSSTSSSAPRESHAVQGTLVLEQKPAAEPIHQGRASHQPQAQNQSQGQAHRANRNDQRDRNPRDDRNQRGPRQERHDRDRQQDPGKDQSKDQRRGRNRPQQRS